jgi:hypothetical protein
VNETNKLTNLLARIDQEGCELALIVKDKNGKLTVQQWGDTATTASGLRLMAEATITLALENEQHSNTVIVN